MESKRTHIAKSPEEWLAEVFGFASFLPGQRKVIECLLSGHSSLAIFPTGGGKSLCYQLPALTFRGTTLVISPLIALMKDQIDFLKRHGLSAEKLDSTLTLEENRAVMTSLRSGRLKLLYVAPERFNNERFLKAIETIEISMFVVDEAHCISEWGHNFRPDYLKLARFAKTCKAGRILALTATATPKVAGDIRHGFDIADDNVVQTGFYRSNLTLLHTLALDARDAMLLEKLASRPQAATIIYVTLQKTSHEVADRLAAKGLPAKAYHAGMTPEDRSAIQEWFMTSPDAIIVATIAFGMGIDKADIRYVYHYNLPKSLENYAQEIGRAGRDQKGSICEMLVDLSDVVVLENFAYGDTPGIHSLRTLLAEIFSHEGQFDVSLYDLAVAHDIRELVLKTLLVELELAGYLYSQTPFYARYTFKPLVGMDEMLAPFDDERRGFLKSLFAQATKARIWHSIDLDEAASMIAETRDRIVRALDHLAEKGFIEMRAEGVRSAYQMVKRPDQLDPLTEGLYKAVITRETREIGRINQVVEFTKHPGCRSMALAAHFGEQLPAGCGHCSFCLGDRSAPVETDHKMTSIDPMLWDKVVAAWQELFGSAHDARSLARFAAGISSPHMAKARASRHPLFGALSHLPFKEILDRSSHIAGSSPHAATSPL